VSGTGADAGTGDAPEPTEDDWFSANRAMWDERVPIHVGSDFYGVEEFKAGRSTLHPFEVAELGPVRDRELVHLQCHFGLDTLSWAREGARVTGLIRTGDLLRHLAEEFPEDVLNLPPRPHQVMEKQEGG